MAGGSPSVGIKGMCLSREIDVGDCCVPCVIRTTVVCVRMIAVILASVQCMGLHATIEVFIMQYSHHR